MALVSAGALTAHAQAQAAPLDLILLRTAGTRHLARPPEDLGGGALAQRVTVIPVACDHATMWETQGLPGTQAALAQVGSAQAGPDM